MNIPITIDKIIIPNVRIYDKRNFIFYCLSIGILSELDMRKFIFDLEYQL